ncbi:YbaK/EbsC family protein [Streptomyces roseoverticillatus]|uniref:YbaK/EbsC family protein n=1 Tax=Streptomyces roseoverticillatus TaxID=66429 RepID=UPI001F2AF7B6|nr:YbaK/EbsC family protein [Streptomyces roseoverticillatus]MCF3106311.1 YbaK/EbsC family protein [Streptomyces roseoverticillatus]
MIRSSPTVPFGRFDASWPAASRTGLLAEPVATALGQWGDAGLAESVLVVDTDPELADTAAFSAAYDVPLDVSANCVVIAAKRGGAVTHAACVALASTRVDVNSAVRKHLGARKASFAPMDTAVAETGMEYGGITPVGLPEGWPLLVDEAVASAPYVLIGSGKRRSKLILPGALLARLPNAEVVAGLAC